MDVVAVTLLLVVTVSAQFGKHVYVEDPRTWPEAQEYCRDHYTDLSSITTQREEEKLKVESKVTGGFWIGLYKGAKRWKWSGGGSAVYLPWDKSEPEDEDDEIAGSVCWDGCGWNGWHNIVFWYKMPFFCINLRVTETKMSWERALRYCRENHNTLTSLDSETEHLLALTEIQQDHITERVWIGLRYLADSWMWVDGSPLEYQVWPQGGDQDHQCPIWKRCGALSKGGLWPSWDCEDRLNFICY
ncbi:uncharacterized protein V6R79_012736 [Siganus canaliculatus]